MAAALSWEVPPLWELPPNRRCPLMGGVPLWEVPPYGRCPLMGGAPLWEVSPYRRCPLMGGVPLWEVPPHGRCPLVGGVPSWEVPPYGRCCFASCSPVFLSARLVLQFGWTPTVAEVPLLRKIKNSHKVNDRNCGNMYLMSLPLVSYGHVTWRKSR